MRRLGDGGDLCESEVGIWVNGDRKEEREMDAPQSVTRNSSREVRRCVRWRGVRCAREERKDEEKRKYTSTSAFSSLKSKTLALSTMRLFLVDLGITMKPCTNRPALASASLPPSEKRAEDKEGRRERKTHPVQPIPNQHLRRRLPVLLRKLNDDRVVEPLTADEGRPRFEDDTLRFAVMDEVDAGHEGVEVLWRGRGQ
jgi:hypothetical protein